MSNNKVAQLNNDAAVRSAVQKEMQEAGMTQAQVSKETGINQARLNQWLKGSYKGNTRKIDEEMAKWLESRRARAASANQLPSTPDFVEMPSAKRIRACFSYCQMAGDMGLVYGAAGVGKTETAEDYKKRTPSVWIATMSPDCRSAATALEEISDAVGVEHVSGAARMRRAVERRVKDTQGLLIIDDAQALGIEALDSIRSIHDRTGIGVVLCGNEQVFARMTGGNRAAYLDRLYSRIGKRVQLRRPTKRDVEMLIDAWGVKGDTARGLLRKIGSGGGALRRINKVMRVASLFAAGTSKALGEEHIREAVRDLEDAQEV